THSSYAHNPNQRHQYLPFFPTRRSSDLAQEPPYCSTVEGGHGAVNELPTTVSPTEEEVIRPNSGIVDAIVSERIANLGRTSEPRSEEHTSELQSHLNLVCRLLLEKKKQE